MLAELQRNDTTHRAGWQEEYPAGEQLIVKACRGTDHYRTCHRQGELVTLPNVGLQLLDVVTVTDARAGVSEEAYRDRGIVETYDRTKEALVFEQRVVLGGK
jgi:hypothetical protein